MRWDNLKVVEEEGRRLPGYRDPARIRTFDAPEALDTRFYEVQAKSVLNHVPKQSQVPFRWTVNAYRGCSHACIYCFARPTHTYLDFNASEDFEREIVVKVNAPERLRADLARPSWKREHVAIGTNTDPYQWCEGRYELMPGIWEALLDADTPCSILTKSPLLLRDKDIMRRLVDRVGFTANLSVPTLDEKTWRETEPRSPNPRARIEAVAELNRAGIPTGILIAPLIPGVNDSAEQVDRILELATEAGATNILPITLHLRGEVRDIWFDWLRSYRPDLISRYERIYSRGAYANRAEQARIASLVPPGRRGSGQPDQVRGRSRPQAGGEENEGRARREAVQPSLF